MRYKTWEPTYKEILKDFGFERENDDRAAREASRIISHKGSNGEGTKETIKNLIKGKTAIICGNAPCLETDIREKKLDSDILPFRHKPVVIAADGATSVLLRSAVIPDIVVTDLDGTIADIIYANRLGSVIVVHAHGDNIEKLKNALPVLKENVICTTQSRPLRNVYNFGGFTDGDRCVFLAKEFGAERIELIGFDFDDKNVSARKRKKLKWAKRLIGDVL
ncbi:6-hydroxymethyl-7,8-dihydropterin pyrophosphokinase [ANME-1 cluster archaeon GoMg1]|nr:6-hydroxymethyl-7,8-dihydropterin pyrophosphokinase [ANME-1 cluster archaeon GoMg1]